MTSAIEIFESTDGVVSLELRSEGETVWASQADIEELFGIDQSGVSRHIRNILRTEEVVAESNMQKVHIAGSDRPVTLYSLDVVLAVGYRANSARAIEFRRWATDVLKRYLLKGVATNERRLRELNSLVQVLSRSSDQFIAGVAEDSGESTSTRQFRTRRRTFSTSSSRITRSRTETSAAPRRCSSTSSPETACSMTNAESPGFQTTLSRRSP